MAALPGSAGGERPEAGGRRTGPGRLTTQYASHVLKEGGLPARMAARMAALPPGGPPSAGCHPASSGRRAGGLDSCFRRNDGRRPSSVNCPGAKHAAGARGSRLLKECGLPARKRPRGPLSQAARGASGPRRGVAGPAPGGSRHNMHHTSLRRAGFQPASGQDGRSPRQRGGRAARGGGSPDRPREAHDTICITRP